MHHLDDLISNETLAGCLEGEGKVHELFNGIYTMTDNVTGERWTFKINTASKRSKLAGRRIISLLTGPRNTDDYRGIGFVNDDGIVLWRRWQHSGITAIVAAFWDRMVHNENADRFDVLAASSCYVCNRMLTVPESILTGIGPICAERLMESRLPEDQREKFRKVRRLRAQIAALEGEANETVDSSSNRSGTAS